MSSSDPAKVRTRMPKLSPEERAKDFAEVELGFSEEQAVAEAIRCLSCGVGRCVGCRICAEVCPDACISIQSRENARGRIFVEGYELDSTRCMFCGLCTEACPTGCLKPSADYQLSVYNKADMIYGKEKMLRKKTGITVETLP